MSNEDKESKNTKVKSKNPEILAGKWEELWSRIQEKMATSKIKPIDVSRGTGISPTTTNSYFTDKEGAKRTPNGPNILAMCLFLDIPIDPVLFPEKAYDVAVSASDMGQLVKEIRELKEVISSLNNSNQNQSKVILKLTEQVISLTNQINENQLPPKE